MNGQKRLGWLRVVVTPTVSSAGPVAVGGLTPALRRQLAAREPS
ncbi:MAG: hypothetical protein QM711_11690 [Micropruina sp.]